MTANDDTPTVALDDFIRRFATRGSRLMWFLGAGASASAGLPTAFDMILRFKQDLYMSQSGGHQPAQADLSQPAVRHRINAHIASLEGLPPPGDEDEYGALFERAYPSEQDRQSLIHSQLAGGKPSYGHIALAALMRKGLARMIWTTNFDTLVADACAKVYDGTGALTTATLDAPDIAADAIQHERWPLEVKLHGDFRSRRLKNTGDELRRQDTNLRELLQSSCSRLGLVVVGYSGRDESIMQTLAQVTEERGSFPGGLFWLRREDDPVFESVRDLVRRARDAGVEAALVTIHSFDETLRDVARFVQVDEAALRAHAPQRERWTSVPRLAKSGAPAWPVVRFNALPVVNAPTNVRLVVCDVGGTREVRDAVAKAGVDVVAVRSQRGVLAFGSDADVTQAFEPFSITEFDLYPLEPWRSAERGLLNDAAIRAVAAHCGLTSRGANGRWLFPKDPHDPMWAALRRLVGQMEGQVGNRADVRWHEGIRVRLEFASGRHRLLFDPCTVFEGAIEENKASCADFARERTVRRYNKALNALITFWAGHLAQDGRELRAIGTGSGVDAVFQLSAHTAFSRRTA